MMFEFELAVDSALYDNYALYILIAMLFNFFSTVLRGGSMELNPLNPPHTNPS